MDLTKLSKDQLRIASKIYAEAEKQGVDPDQIIPLAMAENRFGNATSPAGALGPMQLMPDRAKLLNVNPKDEDDNIKGGVMFFKQLYNDKKVGGGDPERLDRVYAAYNAGPGTAYVRTGDPKDLPGETLTYLKRITDFRLGAPTTSNAEAPSAAPSTAAVAPSTESTQPDPWAFDYKLFSDKQESKRPAYGFDIPQDIIGGGIGTAVGATVGAVPAAKQGLMNLAQDVGESFRGTPSGPSASGSPAGVRNWALSQGYKDRGAPTYEKAHVFESGTRKGSAWTNPATGESKTPSFKFQKPPAFEAPPPTMGQQVKGALGAVASSPITKGALGGFGMGAGGVETESRLRRGDIPGAVLAGTGALASAAGMAPPLTLPATLVGLGSAGALATLDKARNKMASEGPSLPVTPREEQMYQKPFFGKPSASNKPNPLQYNGALLQELDQQMKQFSSSP
jgi:hypothetical protein